MSLYNDLLAQQRESLRLAMWNYRQDRQQLGMLNSLIARTRNLTAQKLRVIRASVMRTMNHDRRQLKMQAASTLTTLRTIERSRGVVA